jgi:hypothetical protein
MAFVIADRVRESSVSTGTGNFTLAGAVTGYQTFASVMATSDTTFYTIADQGGANWEVGIGTFTSPSTLARTTILSSSNGGSVVTFGAGTKDVFISLPASRTNVEDQPNLIEVNSSSAALRITQIGAGNALVVEDSANPDATPFVVEANGRLIVGSTQTQPSLGATNTPSISVFGNSASNNGYGNYAYTVSTSGSFFNFVKSRSATPGSFAIVNNADDLGYIKFIGDDGTQFVEAARIMSEVDGTPAVNDMPGRLLFSTTPAGSASPVERMRIGSTGNIGIGTAGTEPFTIRNLRAFSGATTAYGISQGGEIQSAVTASAYMNHTAPTTQATSFVLTNVYHYSANSLSIGAGSSVTNQYGFSAQSGLTTATNNYGFHSNIASGTGRWNFYAAGTADNYFGGNVGIGTSSLAGYNLRVSKSLTGAVTSRALLVQPTVQSDVTTSAYTVQSIATTAAASFTLPALFHYSADQGTFGAGSTVTNQYGFFSSSGLISATTNYAFLAENTAAITAGKTSYGFYSAVNTATGGGTTWGFYAAGTAANYFAGQVQLGAGTAAAPALSTTGDTNTGIFFPAADTIAFSEGGAEVMRINSSGNVGIGTTTLGSKLTVNGDVAGTFFVNPTTVSANYTIPTNYNAMTAGPITVASGAVVTVGSGSTWVIV